MKLQNESSESVSYDFGVCQNKDCGEVFNYVVHNCCPCCYPISVKNIDAQLRKYDDAMVKKKIKKDIL